MSDDKLRSCPFCGGEAMVWHGRTMFSAQCKRCKANGPIKKTYGGAVESWNALDMNEGLRRDLVRAELVHKRTAEHLRQERKRRRLAECANSGLHRQLRAWYGGETVTSLFDTPAHYQGDGLVTCRRAMESCESQEKVVEPSRMAFCWWACAFKCVWRCWSKEDPEADMHKAIDCLRKAMGELPGCARQVAHERVEWCGVTREESNG